MNTRHALIWGGIAIFLATQLSGSPSEELRNLGNQLHAYAGTTPDTRPETMMARPIPD